MLPHQSRKLCYQ